MENNNNPERLTIRILISTAIAMAAVILCYNAVFVPKMPPISVSVTGQTIKSPSDSYESTQVEKVNINTADENTLSENLTGVGPAIAQRIISYRNHYGGFKTIHELKNVKGIGDKMFEKIKDNITVQDNSNSD